MNTHDLIIPFSSDFNENEEIFTQMFILKSDEMSFTRFFIMQKITTDLCKSSSTDYPLVSKYFYNVSGLLYITNYIIINLTTTGIEVIIRILW